MALTHGRAVATYTLALAVLATVLSSVLGCGRSSGPNRTVTAAYVPAAYYLPFLVVENDGLLEKRGYGMELKRFNDNAEMISMFLNGHLDVTAQSALTMFPVENEHPGMFKYVYGQYNQSYFFIVPHDSSIKSVGDLKGQRIGTWKSPTAELFIRLIMRNAGVSDNEYTIQRFGATEWPSALQNGVVAVAFGFDVPLSDLETSGRFRYLDEDAVKRLIPGEDVFNGGAFLSTRLISEDPEKAKAIRDALLEAVEIIRTDRDRVNSILATKLRVTAKVAARTRVDLFTWPNDDVIKAGEATLDLLVRSGAAKPLNVGSMFWFPSR